MASFHFSVKLTISCDFVVKLSVALAVITRFTYISKITCHLLFLHGLAKLCVFLYFRQTVGEKNTLWHKKTFKIVHSNYLTSSTDIQTIS